MNIHASPAEAALLHLSSLQRREPRAESMADYDKAMAEFERLQHEAHTLRRYIDQYAGWLFPTGNLEDEWRELRASAVSAWREARDIAAKMKEAGHG